MSNHQLHTLASVSLKSLKDLSAADTEFSPGVGKEPAGKIQLAIYLCKFYWNTVTPIHLPIVYGCFHATAAELRQNRLQSLKYLLYRPSQKKSDDIWFRLEAYGWQEKQK